MALIYLHRRLDTNQVFYIGIGNTKQRAYSKNNRNLYWHNIVSNIGYNVEIIEENLSWEEACQKEKYWIKLYGRKDLNEGTLVNMTDGGDGGDTLSSRPDIKEKFKSIRKGKTLTEIYGLKKADEIRSKIRKNHHKMVGDANPAKRPEVRKKIGLANTGKTKSAEERNRLSKLYSGEGNPFFNKTHNENAKLVMREKAKGRYTLDWFIEKYGLINGQVEYKKKCERDKHFLNKKDYKYPEKKCPVCGKVGAGGNMKRYHFENCKIFMK